MSTSTSTQTITLYTYACRYSSFSDFEVEHFPFERTSHDHATFILLGQQEVEIETFGIDQDKLDYLLVVELEQQKTALQAVTHQKCKAIDERIQALLAIENKDAA